ncbi:unnamed protein product [Spirodela intermedia]|uniref:Uncharacterized protein n=2 Tax=Spirodela intermedia TaxID=51605 RepID=A0A7I8KPD2_SPIIN|nr:unnamed protein product [Spirodela intermedia]CAA6662923.1 unnamed protein product [Spirodela intermedia]CAA7399342.1 unnamed protein product [Spirodela intermedia]
MKMERTLQGQVITTLIDLGATHNFICTKLCAHLKVPYTKAMNYEIFIENGEASRVTKFARNNLHINVNKCKFSQLCIKYLGYWISTKGVATNKGKISTMINLLL